ncbi:MAG TPA: phosphate signaling complex protein PhoU [Clostridia bacterium]|nr:phosphate signaling complex protein PhoU [Clostridiaceae bacterium]HOF26776.1 phosphate signaling complex protein PhoU [Clostridia bacterium]HOM33841.1 phosphate signaling complex protein PhoU [Clostridia bacterium]HOR89901.1 phosphate signaling complex protein PhoU [Clostridia bacterium]HOT69915.1 phosphate signaling complex protein PhoU [Clostridia bacterium]
MRSKFDMQLEILNNSLIEMGAMCEKAISSAIKALLENNISLAKKVMESVKDINQAEKDIEAMCLKLLLQQQPVARDLRQISSILKMITDMDRIGVQAGDIAEIVTFANLSKNKDRVHIADMAEATIKMVTESINAFVKKDLELANKVIAYDDVVDDLFVKVRNGIVDLISKDKRHGEQAIDIIMIAKYLERIGDHATNIAGWVAFSITGIHVEL